MSHSLQDPIMIGLEKTIRKISMDIRRQEQSDPTHVKALADLVKAFAQLKETEKPETEWNYEQDGDPTFVENLEKKSVERQEETKKIIRRRKALEIGSAG